MPTGHYLKTYNIGHTKIADTIIVNAESFVDALGHAVDVGYFKGVVFKTKYIFADRQDKYGHLFSPVGSRAVRMAVRAIKHR